MVVRVREMQPAALVELVNEWGTTPRAEAGEQDHPYPPHTVLTGRLGIPRSATPSSDRALAAIADRLHPVFATDSTARRVRLVNALLADSDVRPAVRPGEPGAEGWIVDDPKTALLAAAAVTLRTQFAVHAVERLGVCAGQHCADVYIDGSPTARRRFCSLTCQNRARVAAFRRRRAATR